VPVPFPPGTSGDPKGSSFGSRHKVARLLDTLALDEAAKLFRTVTDAALAGDMMAAKLVLDRIWPPRKGRPIRLDLPESLETSAAMQVIVTAMAKAEISAEEAQAAAWTVLAHGKVKEPPANEPKLSRVVVFLPDNGRSTTPVTLHPNPFVAIGEQTLLLEALAELELTEARQTPPETAPINGAASVELVLPLPEDPDDENEDEDAIRERGTPVYEHHAPTLDGVAEPVVEPAPVSDTPVISPSVTPPARPPSSSNYPPAPPGMDERKWRRWLALSS
jgi:hypothetical protein